MSSASDKLRGKTNQAIGKVSDNKKVEAKGNAQETKGKVKDMIKKAGEAASEKVDNTKKKS